MEYLFFICVSVYKKTSEGSTGRYLQWHLNQHNLLVDCVIVRLRSLSEIIVYRINSAIKKKVRWVLKDHKVKYSIQKMCPIEIMPYLFSTFIS